MGMTGSGKNDWAIKKIRPEKTGYKFFSAKITGFVKKIRWLRRLCAMQIWHIIPHTESRMCLIVPQSGLHFK